MSAAPAGDCARAARLVSLAVGLPEDTPWETCPLWSACQPEAHDTARLHAWWDKGALGQIRPYPTQVEVDAIDAVESGIRALRAEELRRIQAADPRKNDPRKGKRR